MAKTGEELSFHIDEKQGSKRFCSDEPPSAKKRKLNHSYDSTNANSDIRSSGFKGNKSFANDRLKRLRTDLKNEVNCNNSETKQTSYHHKNLEQYSVPKNRSCTLLTSPASGNEQKYYEKKVLESCSDFSQEKCLEQVNKLYTKSNVCNSNISPNENLKLLQKKRARSEKYFENSKYSNLSKETPIRKTCFKKSLKGETSQKDKIFKKKYLNPVTMFDKICPSSHKSELDSQERMAKVCDKSTENFEFNNFRFETVDCQNSSLDVRAKNIPTKNNFDFKLSEYRALNNEDRSSSVELPSTPDYGRNKLLYVLQNVESSSPSTQTNVHPKEFSKNNNFKLLNKPVDDLSSSSPLFPSSKPISMRKSMPGQIQSSIQERTKKSRVSCPQVHTNSSNPIIATKVTCSEPFSAGFSPSTSRSINELKENLSFSKHEEIEKLDSSNYWINYGHIVNSLFMKYFSSQIENKDGNSQLMNNGGNFVYEADASMDWEEETDPIQNSLKTINNGVESRKQELYIIVDTNIFLRDLSVLQEIVNCGSNGGTKPILYVPWMVLSELDFMKDNKNTADHLVNRVRKAVDFINKALLSEDRKLIGQNVFEADQQMYVGKAPDDKIISCCVQAKQKYHNVILLTNDINLKNKSLVNDVPALSVDEMLKEFEKKSDDNSVLVTSEIHEKKEKVLEEMSTCCSYVICECAKEAYGTVWNKMGMLQNPPWSLRVCLQIFKKYWSGVFRDKLLKQCSKTMDDLSVALRDLEFSESPDNFNAFVGCCLSLCFFLKDLEEHKKFIEETVKSIKSVTEPHTTVKS